ncbi:MAG: hypothetical protein H7A46_12765 [Verrucomicrobiales bacterium]|nr:hypothetical protein [Verrucomicrobiales bacterium]
MKTSSLLIAAAILMVAVPGVSLAQTIVTEEQHPTTMDPRLHPVPAPALNDAAAKARFTLVAGQRDRNGGDLAVLHDGRLPTDADQPSANFFFQAGTDGGRLQLDLDKVIAVQRIRTYSWHPTTRGPQVYEVFGSDGAGSDFAPAPGRDLKPESCGWQLIAKVDTRPTQGEEQGGQYLVTLADKEGRLLGRFRYLLFDISRTEAEDAFGNTFYSEIDVIDADGPPPTAAPAPAGNEPVLVTFDAGDGAYHFTIDATAATDLADWVRTELKPVVQEWYPKLVAMLPSEGFSARTDLTLVFRDNMGGTPASAGGGRINLNSQWFRGELKREARGAVVHEMVHVVQDYGRARRTNRNATRTPGWLVEGIADYIRWFLYEPETRGAEISARNLSRARYDASYRVTGNFLDWVTRRYDKDLVKQLNALAREGKYTEAAWEEVTGKTLPELGDEWRQDLERRINGASEARLP